MIDAAKLVIEALSVTARIDVRKLVVDASIAGTLTSPQVALPERRGG